MKAAEFIRNRSSIPDAFHTLATELPRGIVYSHAQSDGSDSSSATPRRWEQATFSEVQAKVNSVAQHLKTLGVAPGSKVAILSGTRPEWMIADLAILSLGGITAPVYQSLVAEEVAYILFDSESEIVFAENAEQVAKLFELSSKEIEFAGTEDRAPVRKQLTLKQIIVFEQVEPHPMVVQYSVTAGAPNAPVPAQVAQIRPNDIATFVYTSGTTGPPKGVVQTHGNHLANVRQAYESGMLVETSSISLILPLAHSFARLMGYLCFLTPAELKFPAIVDKTSSKIVPLSVTKDLREGSAHINPVVPRLLEKMKDGIVARAKKQALLRLTLDVAQRRYAALKAGRSASVLDQLLFFALKPVRNLVRNSLFGPHFKFCVSGGAKLPLPVAEFFDSLGMTIIEGYGLTETCVATNVGRVASNRLGTVGPVIADDVTLRIAEDGEILYKGPNIAIGYHNRPTATAQSWDSDGWFHTGDLGAVDPDGYLRIVGRKKDLIVTSGGKNIAPHDIEVGIKKCPLVSQAVLIGDGRKYCVALVSLDIHEARALAKKQGFSTDQLHTAPAVHDQIWQHVAKMNEDLSSYETVKKIFIVPEDFSVENGQMTPTFKIKRNVVEKIYEQQIDALYPQFD